MTDLYYLLSIGVLAGTNIAACVGWWRTGNLARHRLVEINEMQRFESWLSRDRFKAKRELAAIKDKRSAAAKHARAAQIAKAQALRDATTAQLDGEVRAKARKLRVAA